MSRRSPPRDCPATSDRDQGKSIRNKLKLLMRKEANRRKTATEQEIAGLNYSLEMCEKRVKDLAKKAVAEKGQKAYSTVTRGELEDACGMRGQIWTQLANEEQRLQDIHQHMHDIDQNLQDDEEEIEFDPVEFRHETEKWLDGHCGGIVV